MRYTIRHVPRTLDLALRRRARSEGRTLNAVAIEALRRGLAIEAQVRRDLGDVANTWINDEAIEAALRAQDRVDTVFTTRTSR